jgi:hypothetical protein
MQMIPTKQVPLRALFEQDETAWLDIMSNLAAEGRYAEMDHANLSEYLADMAKRDRREVSSRLVLLLLHLLKWEYQPDSRTGSWQATILEQRRALRDLLESGTLYNHAFAVLPTAYADACKQASAESGLPLSSFPDECAWALDDLLADQDA